MPDEGIKTQVGVQGDKEYKAALTDIGRQLKVLNSDMKASQSAFGDQATTMAGLQDKLSKLGAIYEAQSQKVDLIASQLEKAKEEYGENSTQADQLRIALNNATAQMNNTAGQIKETESGLDTLAAAQEVVGDETDATNMTLKEAEQALKDAADGSGELVDESEDAADAVGDEGDEAGEAAEENSKLQDALSKAGEVAGGVLKAGLEATAAALAAVTAAAGAAIAKTFEFTQGAGTYADDLLTLSTQVGVSADKLQEWSYSSNFIDTSVDTITGSMTKMLKYMGDAADGSDSARAKFEDLGITFENTDGSLRDTEDVFWDAIDALGQIENPAERDAAAMELFGKSAKELNPLIEAGSQAWREMGQEARNMGTVFSQENLNKMGAFDDAMQRFKATGPALKNSIGLTMIPAFQPLVDAASQSMGKVAQALQDGVSPEEIPALLDELLDAVGGALDDVVGLIDDAIPMASAALSKAVGALAQRLPGLAST
ncbi:MAG: hypothetical protein IJ048_02390, partial [Clostridia bacterium]|nr:hypothetical protein [Clostridia bacterium]